MNKIPNIALYEENDSELAKYTIMQLQERINKVTKKEEEIMYLANKSAITTQNVEVKAIRDRLEDIFEILKGDSNAKDKR